MDEILTAQIDLATWKVTSDHKLLTKEVVLEVVSDHVYALSDGLNVPGLIVSIDGLLLTVKATKKDWILISNCIDVTERELLNALGVVA